MESTAAIRNAIEHTLLKPDATQKDFERLTQEAIEHGFFGVCVNPYWVPFVKQQLRNSSVQVVTVVGFPTGAQQTSIKAHETARLVQLGADEIDMVMNIGALIDQDFTTVEMDIKAVLRAAEGRPVKVIIETGLLSYSQKIAASEACVRAGAHFVKTCTGFSTGQATVEDIHLISQVVDGKAQVKASGGVRTPFDAISLLNAGASRLGTSSGIKLIQLPKI